MMRTLTMFLDRLLSQEEARANAAHAAIRMQHRRHELDDINAFLAAYHRAAAVATERRPGATAPMHAQMPRAGPL
jgi:hypothetical protein